MGACISKPVDSENSLENQENVNGNPDLAKVSMPSPVPSSTGRPMSERGGKLSSVLNNKHSSVTVNMSSISLVEKEAREKPDGHAGATAMTRAVVHRSASKYFNKEGIKVSDMITNLLKSKYRSQLPARFDPIYKVMRSMFGVSDVTIALVCRHPSTKKLSGYRIGTEEGVDSGEYFDFSGSPLETLFRENMHKTLWIEDVSASPGPKSQPVIHYGDAKYLAAAPLWSSDGTFVGAATVADRDPRPFNPTQAMLLYGLTEVILRDLEHFYIMSKADSIDWSGEFDDELIEGSGEYDLSASLREAVLLIDRNWTCLYGNMTWESMSGYGKQETEGTSFWAFFKEAMGLSGANLGFLTDSTPAFTLEGYLRRENGLYTPCKAKVVNVEKDRRTETAQVARMRMDGNSFNLAFPSDSDQRMILCSNSSFLDQDGQTSIEDASVRSAQSTGIGDLPSTSTWSVTITLDRRDAKYSQANRNVLLDNAGLKVGDITLKWRIGQGGFGVVFAGSRPDGKIVAVKLTQRAVLDPATSSSGGSMNPHFGSAREQAEEDVSVRSTGAQNFKDPFLEALLSVTLNHPNLVRSYEYVLTKEGDEVLRTVEGLVNGGAPPLELMRLQKTQPPGSVMSKTSDASTHVKGSGSFVWLVQEYCDLGTLDRASITGSFIFARNEALPLFLSTLWDVAHGLKHLHSRNLIHGDLTGNNVLLKTLDAPQNGKPYIAKISDFGLTRLTGRRSNASESYSTSIITATFGTIIYMPPELVCDGVMNSRTDSYSFGALIYLMLTGKRPFSEFREHQLLMRFVARVNPMIEIPQTVTNVPADILKLASDCLQNNYRARPTAAEIAVRIKSIWESCGLNETYGVLTPPN